MKVPAPLSRRDFEFRLRAGRSGIELSERSMEALFAHYEELHRWAPKLDLMGPGAFGELIERHYAESLAALSELPREGTLVDIGSGAGFPGFVLAAARPDLDFVLVESRARKCAFLESAARRARVACRCLNARVDSRLPQGIPRSLAAVTLRAVRLSGSIFEALADRMKAGARLLIWSGEEAQDVRGPFHELPAVRLASGERRFLRRYVRNEGE